MSLVPDVFQAQTLVHGALEANHLHVAMDDHVSKPFDWVCNNPNKIGKQIYNQTLKSFEDLMLLKNPQCIISVATRNDQTDIKKKLDSLNMSFMSHYYFFC